MSPFCPSLLLSFSATTFLRYCAFSFSNLTIFSNSSRFSCLPLTTSLFSLAILAVLLLSSSLRCLKSTFEARKTYSEKDCVTVLAMEQADSQLSPLMARLCETWVCRLLREDMRWTSRCRCASESSKRSREEVWLQLRMSLSLFCGRWGASPSREGLLEAILSSDQRRVCVLSRSRKMVEAEEMELRQLPTCRKVGRLSLTSGSRNFCSLGPRLIQYQDYLVSICKEQIYKNTSLRPARRSKHRYGLARLAVFGHQLHACRAPGAQKRVDLLVHAAADGSHRLGTAEHRHQADCRG